MAHHSGLIVLVALALVAPLAVASHGDGTYDIPVWFQWTRGTLDVYIVPPTHGQLANGNGVLGGDPLTELDPLQNSYVRATEDSVANWDLAIATYAPAWLKSKLTINVFLVGRDVPTIEAAPPTAGPEIVIVFDENKGPILGFALSTKPCIVDNSRMLFTSFTYEDMFNINAQEYGHCLGLDHVLEHPVDDAMNGAYAYSPGAAGNPRNCVSNLDVAGLSGVFARQFGQPVTTWGAAGHVSASAYARVPC